MNKISAVIITHNEERNIRRCLESLVDVADEVVVVDSWSEDGTKEICSAYPVRFVNHPWEGYVATKNFANSLASNDLILSIDADEALSPALAKSIQSIKNQVVEGKAFSMNRLMNYCGKWIRHCGWYPDTKVRIFDRRAVSWTGQKVHETLNIPREIQIVHLDGDLLHYSFYTPEEHRRQTEKFAALSAEEIVENGKHPGLFSAYLHAGWKFLRDYVFKAGFLDGATGWTICKTNAYGVLLKYLKARKL
ncbi:MAG: glycosyltransferase family 2 protein [Bacteroidales bacterium]|nr:glycosyltransferase family 2 protein [Bacteroidales bacterium]